MHVQLDLDGSRRDVEIVVHHPDATVADLLDALEPGGEATGLAVDGRVVPARQRLDRAGVVPGATLRPTRGDQAHPGLDGHPGHEPVAVVRSVGGLDAGRRWRLAPGRHRVGRSSPEVDAGPTIAIGDATVSADHAVLEVNTDGSVAVVDLGSRNGTWIGDQPCGLAPTGVGAGDLLRCGATQLAVESIPLSDTHPPPAPVRRSGARPFHRPPRPGPPPEPAPIEPPAAPTAVGGTSPIGVVSIVVPIVLGLVMVRVLHSWTYALFMLLSPVMLIGTAIEQRRRGRRTRRRDAAAHRRALDAFDHALDAARREAERRRRARLPGIADAVGHASDASPRLWERRSHHPDAFVVSAGLGPAPWAAPVRGDRQSWSAGVAEAVERRSTLADAPIDISVDAGQVVGVAGHRSAALAVARSLVVQTAVLHGPADVAVAVAADDQGAADWDWVKWLPHTAATAASGGTAVAVGPGAVDELVDALAESRPDVGPSPRGPDADASAAGPLLLVVVDGDLLAGADAPARRLLRGGFGRLALVVVTNEVDRLPVATSTVLALDGTDGAAEVHRIDPAEVVEGVHAAGVSRDVAERAARHLAAFTDPEAPPGYDLPSTVALLPLLGLAAPSPLALRARWAGGGGDPAPYAVIGTAADGPIVIDLERDGPHALIAGTTGSGKSELLRTLVASLAAGSSPEHLTFVLIDFKGGSAFAECARLPHTVGFVTDLDDHLAARALRCLEAELRYRERLLAAGGVADLHEYRRQAGGPAEPLPRLVVVIDEFATLAAELPDFVDALVGIAQRGRSLGVHLVLATQRPTGAVNANIQANTDLRIALRVQTREESDDVVGSPAAASLSRTAHGRAIVRLGPANRVTMQTALVSRSTTLEQRSVEIRPFGIDRLVAPGATGADVGPSGTDLVAFVEAARHAFDESGASPPRRPWPPVLPSTVNPDDLPADGAVDGVVPLGLADLPDQQRQEVFGWCPEAGGLLVVGVGGSGTTTAVQTAVLAYATTTGPDALHVYVLDFGAGDHRALAALPHVGAVVPAGDGQRQRRALRLVAAELDRRRLDGRRGTERAHVLLVVDGVGGFRAELGDDPDGWLDLLARLVADGPAVGISTIVTADRPGAVPPAIGGLLTQRLVLRLGDRNEHGAFGVPPSEVPDLPPGRGHLPDGPTLVQVARTPDLALAVATIAGSAGPLPAADRPAPVAVLPDVVDPSGLWAADPPRLATHPWRLPLAIAEDDLSPAALVLHDADHALVAGPARSGRTSALCTLAAAVRAGGPPVHLVGVAGPRSALLDQPGLHRRLAPHDVDAGVARAVAEHDGPVLVLVDDADRLDTDGPIADLVHLGRPGLHVVAAGRAEPLRQTFGHWTRAVRASRTGLLLQPDLDLDGDLLGCHLPRRAPVPIGRGRGWLVNDGDARLVQVAATTGSQNVLT